MRYLAIAIIGLLTIACARPALRSDVLIYVDEFYSKTNGRRDIEIQMVSAFSNAIDKKTVGLCYPGPNPMIEILEPYFDRSLPITRRALILHELGHCSLGRIHRISYFPDHCPTSIMHPSIPSINCLVVHRDDYDKDLFQ